ncbi:hypothetical protein BpHYR1_044857 [Brachionus plicatilis]|uniref:Uncharacterized protein n=1 Tax=Brachionus plicatilis TaxID=10195 RepID=A0A3M7P706_BRAPC|nr:hypothetical protein BpHYR1_044857 [Brachionus plicatilis]
MIKATVVLMVIFSSIAVVILFALFLGVKSSVLITKNISESIAKDCLPLSITLDLTSKLTMNMKQPGNVSILGNSTDYYVYMGNLSEIQFSSLKPFTYQTKIPISKYYFNGFKKRKFNLYPKIGTTISVIKKAFLKSEITSLNTASSTIFLNPIFEFSISSMSSTKFNGRRKFSPCFDKRASTSKVLVMVIATIKFTTLSHDCVDLEFKYEAFADKYHSHTFLGSFYFPEFSSKCEKFMDLKKFKKINWS